MTAVDAVLFDLDDTLCEYRRSGAELLAAAFDAVGADPFFSVEEYYGRYEEFAETTDTVDDLRRECFAALAAERDRAPAVGYDVADAYAERRDHSNVRPLPGAADAVTALAEDHRVGLVTNGAPEMQRRKLSALPFRDAFETVVYAGYDGAAAKPDPEPFDSALDALGVDSGRAVHVGNSLRTDVAGAHAAGLRSCWLSDETATPDPEPHYVLASPRDLADPPWLR